jgi:cytochrome b561
LAGDVHALLVDVLLAFIVLHIGGAMYPNFAARDRVFQRMPPGA